MPRALAFPFRPAPRPVPRRLHLLLVLALVFGTIGSLLGASPAIARVDGPVATASETSEQALTRLSNDSRSGAGRTPLPSDPALVQFARDRSRDMAERGYFSHQIPPKGTMVFDTMTAAGYCYAVAGENIGWLRGGGEPAEARVHGMFLASPTHHAVLMGEDWNAMGVGSFIRHDGRTFYTVLFAKRCADEDAAAS